MIEINVNDVTAGCLLDYPYVGVHYKLISIDLGKQQVFGGGIKNNTVN